MRILTDESQSASWWPQAGDSLIASGIDWETEALIDVSWDSFLTYAIGYKKAADSVVVAVEARETAADLAVYPVCFLYRHYIELMLKGLITLGNQLRDRTSDYPKHHRIRDLWNTCRPLVESACPEGDPADTQTVEKCILELASLDPSGEAFRYSEDKGGNPSLNKATQFSLANMRDVMNRLSGFLGGSYDYMHELLQYQADIDSESF